jgi:MFS family permease
MGAVMGAFSVASVVGVPLSLQLSVWSGWRLPFLVVGGLGLVVTAAVAASLPSLRAHLARRADGVAPALPLFRPLVLDLVRDDRGDHGGWLPGHPQHLGLPADQPRAAADQLQWVYGIGGRGQLRHPPRGGEAVDRFGSFGWGPWPR